MRTVEEASFRVGYLVKHFIQKIHSYLEYVNVTLFRNKIFEYIARLTWGGIGLVCALGRRTCV